MIVKTRKFGKYSKNWGFETNVSSAPHKKIISLRGGSGGRGGHGPLSPVEISDKKSGRQRRPYIFHVSYAPSPPPPGCWIQCWVSTHLVELLMEDLETLNMTNTEYTPHPHPPPPTTSPQNWKFSWRTYKLWIWPTQSPPPHFRT